MGEENAYEGASHVCQWVNGAVNTLIAAAKNKQRPRLYVTTNNLSADLSMFEHRSCSFPSIIEPSRYEPIRKSNVRSSIAVSKRWSEV